MQNTNITLPAQPLPITNLVFSLLGLIFKQGVRRIARNNIYSILKILSEHHPEYFPNVFFTKRGSLDHSKQVEDALFRLGGILNVRNPKYQYLSFDEKELLQFETKLDRWFSEDSQKIVTGLAEEFYHELKKVEPHPNV